MTPGADTQGRGGRRPPTALAVIAALSLILGAALVVFGVTRQTPDPPAPASASSTSDPAPVPTTPPAPTGAAAEPTTQAPREAAPTTGPQAVQTTPPEVEEDPGPTPLGPSAPTQVRVPSIAVSSPLHPLGLAADGTLEVPSGERYDEAAWYEGSPTPGEVGPTVIEGHVTGAGGRPSIFFELGALQPGDQVEVDREDGATVLFEVYRVEQYPKDEFPTVAVYGPTPGPELRLITCGGEWDEARGHHLDNTVAYAQMVPAD